jgi:hypothetical protein
VHAERESTECVVFHMLHTFLLLFLLVFALYSNTVEIVVIYDVISFFVGGVA